jgi:putative spermidine/putrescine transport system permease protein
MNTKKTRQRHKIFPAIILIVTAVFLMLPFFVTIFYSFVKSWTKLLPSGYTLRYWSEVFEKGTVLPAIGRGLLISIAPVLISNLLVILALYTAIVYNPKLEGLIQSLCMIPNTLKGVIIAIPVLSMYAGTPTLFGNRIVMLSCVYCVCILPFVYQGIRNNLHAINVKQILEAAELLGCNRLRAFLQIIVPNMMSGILVSSLLSVSCIFGDFAVIKIIAGNKYTTGQTMLFTNRQTMLQYQCVIVVIMFSLTLVISAIAFSMQNRSQKK